MAFIPTDEHDRYDPDEHRDEEKSNLVNMDGSAAIDPIVKRDSILPILEKDFIESALKLEKVGEAIDAGIDETFFAERVFRKLWGKLKELHDNGKETGKLEALIELNDEWDTTEHERDTIIALDDTPTNSTGVFFGEQVDRMKTQAIKRSVARLTKTASLLAADGKMELAIREAEKALKVAEGVDAYRPKRTAVRRGMEGIAANFDEAKAARPQVIMDGLIYEQSKLLIGGTAKVGKSHFVLELVRSLSTGMPYLKWTPHKPLSVLYVDFELHEWELAERTGKAFGWNVPENYARLSLRNDGSIRNPAALTKELRRHKAQQFEVIVFDCLYKFNDAEDENDNSAMQGICNWLDSTIEEFQITPIIIHHFGKGAQGSKSTVDRFRGASSLVGDMDAIVSLTEHEKEGHVIIDSVVRSFAPTDAFVANWDYPHFNLADDLDASKHAKPGAKRKMSDSEFLAAFPGRDDAKTKEQMCEILGVSKSHFPRVVTHFNEIKTIEIPRKGVRPEIRYYVNKSR